MTLRLDKFIFHGFRVSEYLLESSLIIFGRITKTSILWRKMRVGGLSREMAKKNMTSERMLFFRNVKPVQARKNGRNNDDDYE